jgi:hypothetical protein
VILTGSNSKLLRPDISTMLTGRNRVIRLFPFSFREFLMMKGIPLQDDGGLTTEDKAILHNAFEEYRTSGGFPEVVKQNDVGLARTYFEDIITKDIIARYGKRNPKAVKEMALFLVSNTGRQVSYPTMARMVGIKSLSTVKKYLDQIEESYLFQRINKFSYSLKKQAAAPSKYYAADVGFITSISFRSSQNRGQRLENVVFNHLDRTGMEVYYHQEKRECDFILKDGPSVVQAIQVADELPDRSTREREIAGLMEAMEDYKLDEGLIVTSDVTEDLEIEDRRIRILPAWRWMGSANPLDHSSTSV